MNFRVIDLTQRLSIHTPPWPSYIPLQLQYFKRIAGAHMGQGANGQVLTTSNHVGTHIDGEIHFFAAGRSIGQMELDEFLFSEDDHNVLFHKNVEYTILYLIRDKQRRVAVLLLNF